MVEENESVWEVSRGTDEPVRFNDLILKQLKKIMELKTGTKDRHRALRDLQDLLSPYIDTNYEMKMELAKKQRDRMLSGELPSGVDEEEDVQELYHSLWLSELCNLLKREGFYGIEWVRG